MGSQDERESVVVTDAMSMIRDRIKDVLEGRKHVFLVITDLEDGSTLSSHSGGILSEDIGREVVAAFYNSVGLSDTGAELPNQGDRSTGITR